MSGPRPRRWWPSDGDEPDPRWSLANERTLLAYSRTAIALVVAGLAVSGSYSAADVPVWFAAAGVPLIALGAFVAVAGRRRFIDAQRAMRAGEDLPPPDAAAAVLPWGIAAIGVLGLVLAIIQLVE